MRKLFYILLLLAPFTAAAQYSGFMGKKVIVQANVNPWFPIIQNLRGTNYERTGNRLNEAGLLFGLEGRASMSYYPKRNVGFGLELGLSKFAFDPPTSGSDDNYYYFSGQVEMVDVRQTQIMPKIEISNKQGLLPVGIAHTLGFGINTYQMIDRDYLIVDDDSYNPYDEEYLAKNYYDWRYSKFKGMSIMYGLSMRMPITERLLFTYNLTYSINVVFENKTAPDEYESSYFVSSDEMFYNLRKTCLSNVMRAGLGLALTL